MTNDCTWLASEVAGSTVALPPGSGAGERGIVRLVVLPARAILLFCFDCSYRKVAAAVVAMVNCKSNVSFLKSIRLNLYSVLSGSPLILIISLFCTRHLGLRS